jgi:hypothetical protein
VQDSGIKNDKKDVKKTKKRCGVAKRRGFAPASVVIV